MGETRPTVMDRSVIDGVPIQIEDLQCAPESEFPLGRKMALEWGHRTTLAVPLRRENRSLGAILLRARGAVIQREANFAAQGRTAVPRVWPACHRPSQCCPLWGIIVAGRESCTRSASGCSSMLPVRWAAQNFSPSILAWRMLHCARGSTASKYLQPR
jgi:hypothetical protein